MALRLFVSSVDRHVELGTSDDGAMQISLHAWAFPLRPAAQPFFETLLKDVIAVSMSLEKVLVEIWPIVDVQDLPVAAICQSHALVTSPGLCRQAAEAWLPARPTVDRA